jgi:hypothetical protein
MCCIVIRPTLIWTVSSTSHLRRPAGPDRLDCVIGDSVRNYWSDTNGVNSIDSCDKHVQIGCS